MGAFLIALAGPILHGGANIADNYLTTRLLKKPSSLIFFSICSHLIFLPLVFLIETPGVPPLNLIPFFLLIGMIEVFYLYPYYKALQADDTSVVSSLFSLGNIFVPILAFGLVGEILRWYQYLGFVVIILSSTALTWKNTRSLQFNRSLGYMLICSALLALEAVIYKYVFNSVSWSTGFIGGTLCAGAISFGFLLIPAIRRNIRTSIPNLKTSVKAFTVEELLTFGGSAASTYAISLISVTVAKSISALQPFFVLLYAILLGRFFPGIFHEKTDRKSILKKFFLFSLVVAGIRLVLE